MGNTSTPTSLPTCSLPSSPFTCTQPSLHHRRNTSATTSSHSALSNALTLEELQQGLNVEECFYVLSTLLQQFYQLYRRSGRIVVGRGMCTVNALGEVKVNSGMVEMQAQDQMVRDESISTNLVSLISQILELVQTLARERQWLDNRDYAFFHESVLKLIYRHHNNEDLLYHELTAHLSAFICNLLTAILRTNASQEQIPSPQEHFLQRKRHRRYDSESIESFARRDNEFAFKDASQLSQTVFTKNELSTRYSHINQPQGYRFMQVRTDIDQPHQNQPQPLSNGRNFISAQYSMNIASYYKEQETGKSKVRFKKYTHKLNYDPQAGQRPIKRNKTTANFQHKPHTKSLLQDLARSVQVRDEPSSKSFIF